MFKFKYIILITAVILAVCSAFVSVSGLYKLFSGAGIGIIVLMSALEFAKIITASSLHRYWNKINLMMRIYLISATVTLVSITSMGLYGFLSDAYTKSRNRMEYSSTKVSAVVEYKSNVDNKIATINNVISSKEKRLGTLGDLRVRQENRVDSLILNGRLSQSNKIRSDIAASDREISKINRDIDSLNTVIYSLRDSSTTLSLEIKKLEAETRDNSELGPLLYVSRVSGKDMDEVVNYLILIIIFVFDPLAIILLILANNRDIDNAISESQVSEIINPEQPINKTVTSDDESDESGDIPIDDPMPVVTPENNSPTEGKSDDLAQSNTHRDRVIPTGKITKEDLLKIKERRNMNNRGFSVNVDNERNRPK